MKQRSEKETIKESPDETNVSKALICTCPRLSSKKRYIRVCMMWGKLTSLKFSKTLELSKSLNKYITIKSLEIVSVYGPIGYKNFQF